MVARVNGIEIPATKVTVPLKNMEGVFAKHMGRPATQEDGAALVELQTLFEHWLLCAKIRELALRKPKAEVSTDGAVDPQKTRELERLILEEAAKTDPELAAALREPGTRPRGELVERAWRAWERRELAQANIEIIEPRYRPCLDMLPGFVDAPPLADVITAFFAKLRQPKADR